MSTLTQNEKQCKKCGRWKSVDEFTRDRTRKDGWHPYCLVCNKERARQIHRSDPEAWARRNIDSYYRHRDQRLETVHQYRSENIDRIREYDRVRNAERYEREPEKRIAYTHARRARERAAGGNFTGGQFKKLCEEHSNKCLCCGKSHMKLTPDHVIPLSQGGSNDISNIQPLCLQCNLEKATKVIDYR